MSNKKIVLDVIRAIKDLVIDMSEDDVNKFLSEEYELSLKFTKTKINKSENERGLIINNEYRIEEEVFFNELLSELNRVDSREKGFDLLSERVKTKTHLEKFAKFIDVGVQKTDKLDKIKENIIESTVGARLRSEAIQGRTIN